MPSTLTALLLTDARVLALPDALRATLATALALCRAEAGAPVSLAALAGARRRSCATVRRHLAALARQGWPLTHRVGRALLIQADAIAVQPVALLAQDETTPAQTSFGVNEDSAPSSGHEEKIEAQDEQTASSSVLASIPSLDAVAQELVALGVYPELAAELARLPWATPSLVRRCTAALRARKGVHSLPGLLVTVLRNRQSAIAAAAAAPRLHCRATARRDEAARMARETAPAASPALQALQEAWRRALVRLQTTWDPQAVALHLAGAGPLGAENGVLLLGVPNAVACDWLNIRARGPVLTALDTIAGQPPLKDVRFVVARRGECQGGACAT